MMQKTGEAKIIKNVIVTILLSALLSHNYNNSGCFEVVVQGLIAKIKL